MNTPIAVDCLLMLSCPAALTEELTDLLQALPAWVPGYTLQRAEGAGEGIALRSAAEQVRGHARRCLVSIPMAPGHRDLLLAELRARLPTREVAWWSTPLAGHGSLA